MLGRVSNSGPQRCLSKAMSTPSCQCLEQDVNVNILVHSIYLCKQDDEFKYLMRDYLRTPDTPGEMLDHYKRRRDTKQQKKV